MVYNFTHGRQQRLPSRKKKEKKKKKSCKTTKNGVIIDPTANRMPAATKS